MSPVNYALRPGHTEITFLDQNKQKFKIQFKLLFMPPKIKQKNGKTASFLEKILVLKNSVFLQKVKKISI